MTTLLTILGDAPKVPGRSSRYLIVRCACGVEKEVRRSWMLGPKPPQSCGCQQYRKLLGPRAEATPSFVPVRPAIAEVYVPPHRLLGRAFLALTERGPLSAPEIAKACRLPLADLEDRAGELRPGIHALRIGEQLVLFTRFESWERIDAVRRAA